MCVCVRLWNWTCFGLIPPIGHTSSKNRNQFCFLSSHLISLLAVPFLAAPCRAAPAYISHFFKKSSYLHTVHLLLRTSLCTFFPSLSSPAVSPDVCCNSVPWIYSSDRVYMASSGCHSAAWMGPQFTMSIGSQVSACHFHSWERVV